MNFTPIKIKRKIPLRPENSWKKINSSPVIFEKNRLFITCQAGLEALVKRDNEKIGLTNFSVYDRIVRANATEMQIYEALIWNRFSNRIYLELKSQKCEDFDTLFNSVLSISWHQILPKDIAIVTEATAVRSTLSHTPSIQSIAKKAIVTKLTEWTWTHHLKENREGNEAHIQIFLMENTAYILLDITGNALHKRGYRLESGEAPIKETLAAALVALSGWRFKSVFLDPFCGSGTIPIEAAMLAKNIAPWKNRHFAIENFVFFDKNLFEKAKKWAEEKEYKDTEYSIFWSDIEPNLLKIVQDNATRAWVKENIIFKTENFFDVDVSDWVTIVTNPPYGIRLENASDEEFYKAFLWKMESKNIVWGFITSYDELLIDRNNWKDRKLYNWGLSARFYYKKNSQ